MKRSMIAFAAMMSMAVGGTACGPAAPEQAPASEAGTGEVQGMACGDYGWWTCPSTGAQFYYEAAGCGTPPELYRTNVQVDCEEACDVTCRDSGWFQGAGI